MKKKKKARKDGKKERNTYASNEHLDSRRPQYMENNNCESSVLIDKEMVVHMERGIHQIKYECDHVFTVTRHHTWTQKQPVRNRTERTLFN